MIYEPFNCRNATAQMHILNQQNWMTHRVKTDEWSDDVFTDKTHSSADADPHKTQHSLTVISQCLTPCSHWHRYGNTTPPVHINIIQHLFTPDTHQAQAPPTYPNIPPARPVEVTLYFLSTVYCVANRFTETQTVVKRVNNKYTWIPRRSRRDHILSHPHHFKHLTLQAPRSQTDLTARNF